jgi:hypothetical protein
LDEWIDAQRLAAPDQQVSLTDPDARSTAASGRGSGVVGYNVQVAVETGRAWRARWRCTGSPTTSPV